MTGRAVAVYDLSSSAGYAVYAPGLPDPVFGVARMPPTTLEGSGGPSFKLLFDHICWINRRWPLAAIGFEGFLVPTGGKKDDDNTFTTSPASIKKMIGMISIVELCAEILGIQPHSIHNASWRKYWLGSQRRGTQREAWKTMSKEKARALGWQVKGDDDADALGQLHFLLAKLEIKPDWYPREPSRELVMLGMHKGIPLHV